MNDLTSNPDRLKKAIVQKLESLHRSGIRSIPRVEISAQPAAAPPSSPTVTAAASVSPPANSTTTASQDSDVESLSLKASVPKAVPSNQPAAPAPVPQLAPAGPFTSPVIPAAERASALQIVEADVAQCTRCDQLATSRTQTVFGVGNPNARLVFLGEAPGADEDRLGEPFVGKAGQLLTKIIEACTLKREDIYIMNVLRCQPPGNRNPTPEEAANCRPFFERQFEIIRPEFICCLGSVAATTLLNTTSSVGRLRGKLHDWRGMKVAVTYHPAYLLRNTSAKKHVWADMKMLMREMGIEL